MITIVICLKQWRYNNCIGDKNLIRSIFFLSKMKKLDYLCHLHNSFKLGVLYGKDESEFYLYLFRIFPLLLGIIFMFYMKNEFTKEDILNTYCFLTIYIILESIWYNFAGS